MSILGRQHEEYHSLQVILWVPPIMSTIEPRINLEYSTNVEHVVQSLLKVCLFGDWSSLMPKTLETMAWLMSSVVGSQHEDSFDLRVPLQSCIFSCQSIGLPFEGLITFANKYDAFCSMRLLQKSHHILNLPLWLRAWSSSGLLILRVDTMSSSICFWWTMHKGTQLCKIWKRRYGLKMVLIWCCFYFVP